MTEGAPAPAMTWESAALTAVLTAVDPAGLGGVSLRSRTGPVRDAWLALLRRLLPEEAPIRRVPLGITDDRLLGGLDLAATLRVGRPVAERGILADADGGVVVLAMAERLPGGTAARLAAVLDAGEVVLERDGLGQRIATRFGVIALDEGIAEDERPPITLTDRLAFLLDLEAIQHRDIAEVGYDRDAIAAARQLLPDVYATESAVEALCAAALAFGIGSLRAPLMAIRAARALAALEGRRETSTADTVKAAKLIFSPRATRIPEVPDDAEDAPPPESEPPPPNAEEPPQDQGQPDDVRELSEMVVEATRAALPADLLAQLLLQAGSLRSAPSNGSGVARRSKRSGRPIGSIRGDLGSGARLNVVETLRVAAGWQKLRRGNDSSGRVQVRRDDFRIRRFEERSETVTIFAVDASGSSALNRLAEAKGAVELLLADCYVRRDQVALIGFRGKSADLLLPPTRSLVRAKRSLSGLRGGGGTPLASGIDAAFALAEAVRRKGQTAIIVILTDGQANVARDGTGGRPRAEEDARVSARALAQSGVTTVLVDTSPRRTPAAQALAQEMRARYLPLPFADAAKISAAVRTVSAAPTRGAA